MLTRDKAFIALFLGSLLLLHPSAMKAQEPVDSTQQDSSKNAFTRHIERIVDDVINKIEHTMQHTWRQKDDVESNDSLDEAQFVVPPEPARYDSYSRRRRHEWRVEKLDMRYPLHWSSRLSDLDPFLFRYNRVEGIFLGLGSPKGYYWDGDRQFSIYGSIGYGFKTHRWRYGLGADRWFFEDYRFEVGVEGHSLADTKDDWFIGTGENTLSALFVREDYHNFFGREGFSVHAAQYFTKIARLRVDYVSDEYKSLSRNTGWALFGGDRRFRETPPINNGQMRSAIVSFDFNTVTERRGRTSGWTLHASSEFAGGGMGGDFTFNRYLLEVRKAQPLSRYDKLSFRVRVGSSQGTLPLQKRYELGGIGTLNAYSYKEFSGNRMILGNMEYLLAGSALEEVSFWPSRLFDNVTFIFFADVGITSIAAPNQSFLEGFGKLTGDQWKSDIGVALGSRDGTMRLGFTWPTDGKRPVKIFLRLDRPF